MPICNETLDTCSTSQVGDGTPCDDDDPCTVDEICEGGLCFDDQGEDWIFFEDFDNNNQGWTLDTDWQLGPAVAISTCDLGQDPGTDHTSTTADNGVAGVLIGDCTASTIHGAYCMTSPVVDTTGLSEVSLTYWRQLSANHDPYQHHWIDVYDGANWNTIFTTGPSPSVIDTDWTFFDYDITSYAGAATQVRWCYDVTDTSSSSAASWNIDDITIGPPGCFHEAIDTCGDSFLDPGEECDDGNGDNTDLCADDCTISTVNCLVISNRCASDVAADFTAHMSHINFTSLSVNSYTPTPADFDGIDVVLLFENGIMDNAPGVGDAIAAFHETTGGGVVIGTFYWQQVPIGGDTWGNLHSYEAMTNATIGCEYEADSLDSFTIVTHPVTDGVTALYGRSNRGGTEVAPGATGLAFWSTPNQAGGPDPVVAVRTTPFGETAGVSIFPDYPDHGTYGTDFSGDFWQLFENTIKWVY
ncbi:MAG: hypothetical protein GY700_14975 [Propionibacteriaceae bacterium]|nr:hypothetical protein [Propionibacteriaceae bacterium]